MKPGDHPSFETRPARPRDRPPGRCAKRCRRWRIDIGALVVVDGAQIVGIVTERDYARKGVLMGRDSRDDGARVNDLTGHV